MTFLFEVSILLHTGSGIYAVYQDGTKLICKQLSFRYKFNDRYTDFTIENGKTDYKHGELAACILDFKNIWDSAGERRKAKGQK